MQGWMHICMYIHASQYTCSISQVTIPCVAADVVTVASNNGPTCTLAQQKPLGQVVEIQKSAFIAYVNINHLHIAQTMVYLNQNLTWYIERWLNVRIGDLFVLLVCLGFVCASVGMLLHGALKDRCLSLVDRSRCDQISQCVWNVSTGYCHRP